MKLTDNTDIVVTTNGQVPLKSVDVLIDNVYIATLPDPFHFVFTPSDFGYTSGSHIFTFNATNTMYVKSTIQKTVVFQ